MMDTSSGLDERETGAGKEKQGVKDTQTGTSLESIERDEGAGNE